ncbi:RNA-directed DNA polymerase, eukaryota [Tanacetum coccineum]
MEALRRDFFHGTHNDVKKIAWVKWSKVLSSKKNGGLGVSSFYASNRALLFKWIWRFISQDNSLWARVINAIHGHSIQVPAASSPSLWISIVREFHVLKSRGIDLVSYCKKRIGNGLILDLGWKLPTRLNLAHRGVQVSSLDCPVCSLVHENSSHILFSCSMALDISRLICRWWDLGWSPFGSYAEWLSWFKNVKLSSTLKEMLEGVYYVAWWSIWKFRNQLLFASRKPRKILSFR